MLSAEVKPGELTATDRFVFESWGYFIVPDVLSADEVAECYAASERMHSHREHGFGQLGRGYETEPALEQLIDHPAVLPKVRGLYGDRFILQACWTTMQPAHAGMGRWHQDGSSAYDYKLLGYPIPLVQLRASFLLTDQTEPRMGNMELVPGSHRSQVPLPEEVAGSGDDVPIGHVICAPAGSVLVFHNAVWHRTYAHDGDRDRYTAHYIYSPPWARSADRLENSPEFLERTTPLRRALMGEFARPDAPYGANYDPPPFAS
jgi:ectoine hydroxylase-related dioxygenase (phytanoyl-CoA dioxygenase family)